MDFNGECWLRIRILFRPAGDCVSICTLWTLTTSTSSPYSSCGGKEKIAQGNTCAWKEEDSLFHAIILPLHDTNTSSPVFYLIVCNNGSSCSLIHCTALCRISPSLYYTRVV